MNKLSLLLLAATGAPCASAATAPATPNAPESSYRVETITFPPTVTPEVGGLGFTKEGEIVVALRRFGILMAQPSADPTKFPWRVFSEDILHNACGLEVISKSEMIVSTMDELTRIKDTDGDGIADSYETICKDWGMSGNYHETNTFTPDPKGGWWIAIGTASHNGPVFSHVRGEYSEIGRRGRNFSSVQWKGWVAHIDPQGKLEPWAKGFRANNGIGVGPDDHLYVTDNQGDWRGASPLFVIEKDHFYGHPSSLVWDKTFKSDVDNDPLKHPPEKLEAMRTPAAVEFPEGYVCNSPSQPLFDTTGGKFGPFAGQMFVGDVAGGRVLRVMLEDVDGTMQGACVQFVDRGLRAGNNRLVFSPDGTTLYTGQTVRGWGQPSEGMQRIIYTGGTPCEVLGISLLKDGFRLTFTKPMDPGAAAKPESYHLSRYYFENTYKYGSAQMELTKLTVTKATPAADGKSVEITCDGLQTGRIVQLDIDPTLRSTGGERIEHAMLCYKVNRLRK